MFEHAMKIATIVGARPQFIKAATISRAIAARTGISEVLIHTGQHFDANMSNVFFTELDIRKPDHHLGIGGGTHGENTGRMIEAIEKVLIIEKPDWVLIYGDTDSTLAGALAAVKLHIPLAHVEAGLRSFNRRMPEEINRVLTDHASDLLFVPTITAIKNLANEGIGADKVHLVGDVMYDAMLYYQAKARKPISVEISGEAPFVLCTIHRAENTDDIARLTAIVINLNHLAEQMPVILPLHPRTVAALKQLPGVSLNPSMLVIEPVGFLEMTWLIAKCSLVLTDSGGVQKEAYFHKKPCLTLRDETEWVELVDAGFNRLVSPFSSDFMDVVTLMSQKEILDGPSLYGNGQAANLTLDVLQTEVI
ncbi:MAG: UDP-N-acetylglucosamine 2-epimerase (non-hydrolyzing) [Magnetococcus sp. THC-1_WYH]